MLAPGPAGSRTEQRCRGSTGQVDRRAHYTHSRLGRGAPYRGFAPRRSRPLRCPVRLLRVLGRSVRALPAAQAPGARLTEPQSHPTRQNAPRGRCPGRVRALTTAVLSGDHRATTAVVIDRCIIKSLRGTIACSWAIAVLEAIVKLPPRRPHPPNFRAGIGHTTTRHGGGAGGLLAGSARPVKPGRAQKQWNARIPTWAPGRLPATASPGGVRLRPRFRGFGPAMVRYRTFAGPVAAAQRPPAGPEVNHTAHRPERARRPSQRHRGGPPAGPRAPARAAPGGPAWPAPRLA
jgi:hypothetical protein